MAANMIKRFFPAIIFFAYGALLIKFMVFKDVPMIRIGHLILNFGGTHEGPANWIPFKTIWPYLQGEKGLIIAGMNIIGNIGLLVPIGILLPVFSKSLTSKKALVAAIAAGLSIELLQVAFRVGIFDIDDVILNAIGVMIGYWLHLYFPKVFRSMTSRIVAMVAFVILICMMTFYVFSAIQGPQTPTTLHPISREGRRENADLNVGGDVSCCDPCNGTGGTGQIIGVGKNSITIKGHNGLSQDINISCKTEIRNSAGITSRTDLKMGVGVTIVTGPDSDHKMIASLVLICNATTATPVK